MINMSRGTVIACLLITLLGFLYALPNVLPTDSLERWRASVPDWMPGKTLKLGLDLRGGAYVLLGVGIDQVIEERLADAADTVRAELRDRRLRYGELGVRDNMVVFTLRDPDQAETLRQDLQALDDRMIVRAEASGRMTMAFTEAGLASVRADIVAQSIEVVRRRVDESGLVEPSIQRQGEDRILLQLPGVADTSEILALLRQTAKLNFHLLDDTVSPAQIAEGTVPAGSMVMPTVEDGGGSTQVAVRRRIEVNGENLTNAAATFSEGQPVVSFQFDGIGAKRFCDTTTDNTGGALAIVLDGAVISYPRINEPICQGRGIISGSFTPSQAENLAILLRSGALPAPISVLEERTVGPSLGSDSIEGGLTAASFALVIVFAFVTLTYALFGVFANITLVVCLVFTIALMTVMQATLTLPGLAGLVLTIGMALDSNVLIYERIREELRNGRTALTAIDTGLRSATGTIYDANLTGLIAAGMLYLFGTGPIQGFAVTMGLGILTSLFTSIMLTRLMLIGWLKVSRAKTLPI